MVVKLILFLGSLLILQIADASPTPDNSPMPIKDIGELVAIAGKTYIDFFGYAVEEYRKLFDKVLTAANDEMEKDNDVRLALMPIIDFTTEINENHDRSRKSLQILFGQCMHAADLYDNRVPMVTPEADSKAFKYMYDAQSMKTKFDVLMKYVPSLQRFANSVRKFLNTLPAEERSSKYKKLEMWFVNWQRQHDWEKKNDLMVDFFEIFDDSMSDRERLVDKIIRNTMMYLNEVVASHKNFYRNVARDIEADNEINTHPNDEDVKYTLDVLKAFVERAEKLHELKDKEQFVELLRLFGGIQDVHRRFSDSDLSDNEKKIAKIMQKNGQMDIDVREMLLTFAITEELTKSVEEYLDTRHGEDLEKEKALRDWFERIQDEEDLNKIRFSVLDVLGQLG